MYLKRRQKDRSPRNLRMIAPTVLLGPLNSFWTIWGWIILPPKKTDKEKHREKIMLIPIWRDPVIVALTRKYSQKELIEKIGGQNNMIKHNSHKSIWNLLEPSSKTNFILGNITVYVLGLITGIILMRMS